MANVKVEPVKKITIELNDDEAQALADTLTFAISLKDRERLGLADLCNQLAKEYPQTVWIFETQASVK